MVQTATITNTDEGPTIEESAAALEKEGLIDTKTEDNRAGNPDEVTEDLNAAAAEAEGGDTPERPEWLPEKFKSPEDMAKAYSELEKKQGENADKTTDGNDSETPEGEEGSDKEAREAVEKAGLNFDTLTKEFNESGELSEESIKSLVDGGIPKDYVDAYIVGIQAQTELYSRQLYDSAGGQESYEALLEYGGSNLSDTEIDAFDVAVNSGNVAQAEIAIKGLKAQMELNTGVGPERTVDGKGAGGASDIYESQAQVEADMNDPRYQTDEAFRQKVYQKMARSKNI